MTTDVQIDKTRQLVLGMSNRKLWPIVKQLGGIPKHELELVGATHLGAMTKNEIMTALFRTYDGSIILEAFEAANAAEEQASAKDAKDAIQLMEIVKKIAAAGVSEEKVRDILAEERAAIMAEAVQAARAASAVTIKIERIDAPTVDVGVQHERFPHLLKMLNARIPNGRRLNVWLHGPSSTGKTTAAQKCAEALGVKYYFTGSIETAFQLKGYTDSQGRLVRTPFREAWEHGGVFLMDEADGSGAQAMCALNAAIDGNLADFPDGMIPRHQDCYIVAGANTVGRGGDSKYAGRVRQDESFMARWAMLEWPLDERLEEHLASGDKYGKAMLSAVRKLRSNAKARTVECSLTTRSILDGAAMLRSGLPAKVVLEAACRKGMPETTWELVSRGVEAGDIEAELSK